jgi:hypothetical protein
VGLLVNSVGRCRLKSCGPGKGSMMGHRTHGKGSSLSVQDAIGVAGRQFNF